LAFYYSCLKEDALSTEEKLNQIEALARMTHNNAMCVATACFYAIAVERLFRNAHQSVFTADRGSYTDILTTREGRRQFRFPFLSFFFTLNTF
jgi:ADP-ribosylglycohydrolase